MRRPNGQLVRLTTTHFLAVMGEWAATVGVLVYSYDAGGPVATGITSLAILLPSILGAPATAALVDGFRPTRVRQASFAVQAIAFTVAALAAGAGASAAVVIAAVVVGVGALNTLRPSAAVVLPAVVRSSRELTTGSLWLSHGESAAGLVGPFVAAGLLELGGVETVMAACAIGAFVSFAASTIGAPHTATPTVDRTSAGSERPMRSAMRDLRARPGNLGLLGVASAGNLLFGAFDVLLVVIAIETLDLGESGVGLLNAMVGAGAVASTIVTTVLVRRAALGPALAVALFACAAGCLVLGPFGRVGVYMVALPLIGLSLSLVDNLSNVLLQRSTDPGSLGTLFSVLGLLTGVGQIAGAGLALALVAIGGVDLALEGLGLTLAVVLVATSGTLRRADRFADIPVVEMSLLRRMPMFAPLPAMSLEAVARTATTREIPGSTTVVEQGEHGNTFYGVVDGEFEIVRDGERVRTVGRGQFFGEVALLTDTPRTATVRSLCPGVVLEIERAPFLVAITGHDPCFDAAISIVRTLRPDAPIPLRLERNDPVS